MPTPEAEQAALAIQAMQAKQSAGAVATPGTGSMLFGTVVSPSQAQDPGNSALVAASRVFVVIDGSETPILCNVGASCRAALCRTYPYSLTNSNPAVGARVMLVRVGNQCYVTDVLVGGWSMGAETGTMKMHSSATIPAGWLLCDGSQLTQTDYAALYAVIGYNFTPAANRDGTHFNLPDFKNGSRYVMGAGTDLNGGARPLGGTGGSMNTADYLAPHTHNTGSHTHSFSSDINTSSAQGANTARVARGTTDGAGAIDAGIGGTTGGSGTLTTGNPVEGSHTAVLMPYLAVNFIIAI